MRNIDHYIGGAALASGERHGDVFDPNNGGVQARVAEPAATSVTVMEKAASAAFAVPSDTLTVMLL